MASASNVFDTAISVTAAGSRPASAHARAIASRTAARRAAADGPDGESFIDLLAPKIAQERVKFPSKAQILAFSPKRSSRAAHYPRGKGWDAMRRDNIPETDPSDSVPDRRGTRRFSIRVRLMLLALLALVPLSLDRVRLLEASRSERLETAASEAVDLAKRGADAQFEMINATRAVLEAVARAYVTLAHSGQDCSTFLAGFTIDVPWIRALSVVGPDDRIVCSTRRTAVGLDVSDRPFILDARRSWGFVLSDSLIERTTGEPSVIAAYPTLGKDENVDAIILAPVDLQWVGRLAKLIEARTGASAYLLDRHGTVLAELPRGTERGKNHADHPMVREDSSNYDGNVTAADFNGVSRIIEELPRARTAARLLVRL